MPRSFVYRIGGSGTALTQAEVDNNIMCIYDELAGRYGWSTKAIAGACGCFYEESMMNPGIYETSHGGNLNNLPYFPAGWGLHNGQITRRTLPVIRIRCRGRRCVMGMTGMMVFTNVIC